MASVFKKDLQYYKFCLYGFLKNQKFYEPFFLLFLLSKNITFLQLGILYSIREITINLLEIPAGIIADAAGRRKAMLISFIFYIISFMVFFFSSGFPVLLIAMIIFGIGDVFRTGTHKAIIFDYLEANNWSGLIVEYYGHTRSWSQFGSAISSLLAAIIVITTNNYSMVFAFAIIPYILNLVNLASYPRWLDGEQKRFNPQLFRKQLLNTIKSLKLAFKKKSTIKLYANSSIISGYFKATKDYLQVLLLSLAITIPALSSYSEEDRSSVMIGAIYFFIFLLTSLSSKISGKFSEYTGSKSRSLNITYFVIVMAGILAGLLFHYKLLFIAVLLFIIIYLTENLRRPVAVAKIAHETDSRSLSTFLSTDSQLKSIFTMIFSPLTGLLADIITPGAAISIIGILLLVVSPFVKLRQRKKPDKKRGC